MDLVTRFRETAWNAAVEVTAWALVIARHVPGLRRVSQPSGAEARRRRERGPAGTTRESPAPPAPSTASAASAGVGISNRPLDEERRAQGRLPPAGSARGETEPALPPRPGPHPAPRDPAPKQRAPHHPRPTDSDAEPGP